MTDEVSELACEIGDALTRFKRLRINQHGWKFSEHSDEHFRESEIHLLHAIAALEEKYQGGVNITEISNFLRLKSPTITPMIYNLEKQELVERSSDTADRRITRIKLNDKGKKLLKEAQEHFYSKISELVNHLGKEKSETLAGLIEDIYSFYEGKYSPPK